MKAFFAFVIEVLKNMDLTQLTKPLRILTTADEETTMSGALAIALQQSIKPHYTIISKLTGLVPLRCIKDICRKEFVLQATVVMVKWH